MLEMMVSQDGGIPLLGKCLSGNASDNVVFKERSEKLIEQFKESETPRYLIADSKLYTEKNAINLKGLQFITRIPSQLKAVEKTIDKALSAPDNWKTLDDDRVVQSFDIEHYNIKQRWHVLSSETSRQRAIKQVEKQVLKEVKTIEKFSVYADVSVEEAKANRDNSIPPPAPVFYTVTLSSGQVATGIIDGDVHNQAAAIIITDNNPEGNPNEAGIIKGNSTPPNQEDDTNTIEDEREEEDKKVTFIGPPQIGQ